MLLEAIFLTGLALGALLMFLTLALLAGPQRLKLALLLGKVARSKNPKLLLALVRTGRTILPVVLRYKGNKYWWGRLFGKAAMWTVRPESVYRFAGADTVVTTASIAKTLTPRDMETLEALSSSLVEKHVLEQVRDEADALLLDTWERINQTLGQLARQYKAVEEGEYAPEDKARRLAEIEQRIERLEALRGQVEAARQRLREARSLPDVARALKGFKPIYDKALRVSGVAINFDLVDPVSAIDPVGLETIAEARRVEVVADLLGEKMEERRKGSMLWLLILGALAAVALVGLLLFR